MSSKQPPTRSSRTKCWAARDAYFACLDSHSLWLRGLAPKTHAEVVEVDPTAPKITPMTDKSLSRQELKNLYACGSEGKVFEKECLASWVMHFSLLRVKDLQTQALKKKLDEREKDRESNDSGFWEKAASPTAKQ
ncbi:hypothetical protein SmJEL517_g02713 [Synchytrium microbalum]|uniref:Uncharacterized protein n=1 Tax=Synchytrium microbalum TaxID=1806994 RepID=A0A507C9S0_9FUNG|nr:uncharacterized protein SmJEL517_g02713 [Synchytrium microbalum]TPX34736.1 hypothetical protein SmJEL517_g02713 [Synchytrium microbalum]